MKIIIVLLHLAISCIKLSKTSEVIKKAVSIVNSAYEKYYLTSVVWGSCDIQEVTNFLELYEGTVVIININTDFCDNSTGLQTNVLYKQTVFFAADPLELDYFLKTVNNFIIVSIKVIVVITNHVHNSSDLFMEFTKTAWKNDVGDVIIVGYDTNDTIAHKTYFPYENGACGNYTPVNLSTNTTTYFKSKFRNFNGCPIRVTILDFMPYVKLKKENETILAIGGIDGNLLKLILNVVNSTMKIVSSANHSVISSYENGTRVGTFNELLNNKADIMAPSVIIVSSRYATSQISFVHYTVKVVWCMPNRQEIYHWVKAILPFVNMSTPLIIIAIFIIFVIMKQVKKFGNSKAPDRGNLFKMLGIFLGQPVDINSKHKLVNSLFTFWIWFCLIVRISYQGNLIDGLRKTILEPPIRTLAEALQVVDELGGMPTFIELYRNTSIENKYNQIKLREIPNYLKEMEAGRRYLIAVDMQQVTFFRRKLQILEERVTSVPACIHMRPRWPAAPEISRLIGRLVDSGFIVKIWRDMRHEWLLTNGSAQNTNTVKPLNLETLSSCFYGVIVMYFVSFFVLCLEIIHHRYTKKIKFKKTYLKLGKIKQNNGCA